MKIIYFPLEENKQVTKYELRNCGERVDVKITLWSGTELEFTVELARCAGKVVQVNYMTTFSEPELVFIDVYKKVDRNSYKNLTDTIAPNVNLLRLALSPDTSEAVFFPQLNCEIKQSGFEVVELSRKSGKSRAEYLVAHSDFFATVLTKYMAKAKMLKDTDLHATVAYLESQVDALTKAVLLLAKSKDVKQDIVDILTVADNYSVIAIKQSEKILKEFREDKGNVRRLQKDYYAQTGN